MLNKEVKKIFRYRYDVGCVSVLLLLGFYVTNAFFLFYLVVVCISNATVKSYGSKKYVLTSYIASI